MNRNGNEGSRVADLLGMFDDPEMRPMAPSDLPEMTQVRRKERGPDGVYHDLQEDHPTDAFHGGAPADAAPSGPDTMPGMATGPATPPEGVSMRRDASGEVMAFKPLNEPGYEGWAYRVDPLTGQPIMNNQGDPLLVQAGTAPAAEAVDVHAIPDQGTLELTETRRLKWDANAAAKPHLAAYMKDWIERNGGGTAAAPLASQIDYSPGGSPGFTQDHLVQVANRAFQAGVMSGQSEMQESGDWPSAPTMQTAERRTSPAEADASLERRAPATSQPPATRPAGPRTNVRPARRETAGQNARGEAAHQHKSKLRRAFSGKIGRLTVPLVLTYTFGMSSMGMHTAWHVAEVAKVNVENKGIGVANGLTDKAGGIPLIGKGIASKTHIQKKVAPHDRWAFAGSLTDKGEAVVLSPIGAAKGAYKLAKAPVYVFKTAKGMLNVMSFIP